VQSARADLTLRLPGMEHGDTFLFEHACRVERYAAFIATWARRAIPAKIDAESLSAAAMYHCAAWALRYHDGHIARWEILSKPLSDVHLELSASLAAERLRRLLDSPTVEAVCQIIRESGRRDTTYVPAQIVSEASNLDQIGPLALWQIVRRQSEEGRGIEAALQTWDRQREYNFWHARIKDAFRFPAVRRIAEARLAELDRFMAALRAHSRAEDLASATPETRPPSGRKQPSGETVGGE
jgi:hypothetical protein